MIVKLETDAEKRDTRLRLFKDEVFLIAHEAIKDLHLSLSIEELFATSDTFANFLLENDLTDREIMQYDIDDLRNDISDEPTFYLVISLSFVKLCALRKTKDNAEDVARALVGFCQENEGFTDLLAQLTKKEHSRWLEGKRIDLLSYELKHIGTDAKTDDNRSVMAAIVDSALGLSVEAMQHVENVVSETNDKYNHHFDIELNRLREARREKSKFNLHFDKLNDIHGNSNVTISN